MGRWTPLILMAGGLAILLGTLLGISFPMGGQNSANAPRGRQASQVLPANINVNSTATRSGNASGNGNNVAQNNSGTTDSTSDQNINQDSTTTDGSNTSTGGTTDGTNPSEPIRALW
ncbi:MAG: hypothetical protein ACHBN1_24470 [Heteroscytonema crispum UTEX LB 1556]